MIVVAYGRMEFAEKLERLIDLRSLNQSKLARMTGIAQSAINEMTKGKRRPYMDQAFLIAQALKVDLDYLANEQADEPSTAPLSERERQVWELVQKMGAERAYWTLVGLEENPERFHAQGVEPPKRNRLEDAG